MRSLFCIKQMRRCGAPLRCAVAVRCCDLPLGRALRHIATSQRNVQLKT